MICFLLVSLLFTIRFISCSVDLTLEEGASGSLVVLSSIAKITDAAVFPLPDQQLLRRIAYVETRDGLDSDTYSDSSNNGGIWQLSFGRYKETKTNVSSTILNEINEKLQINWTNTSWHDLRKPLYSALAARLYFEVSKVNFAGQLPVADQADYWANNYTSSGGTITDYETAADFLRDTNEVCGYSSAVDLMFLLDSSVSVRINNFEIMKQFVEDVVSELTIGPNDVQVGVYIYSSMVTDVFNLTTFSNKADIISEIDGIPYTPGTTATDLGLQAILTKGFVDARPVSQGVPRVLVVITDGESNNPDMTMEAANDLHNAGVIVFAIGIASADSDELNAIASKPSNAYFHLTFEDISSLEGQLIHEICTVSPTFQNDVMFTIGPNDTIHGNYPLNTNIGITIKLLREGGSSNCTLYGSTLVENPNQVIYEIKITTSGSVAYVDKYVSVYDVKAPDANTVYVTVECEGDSNITLTVDDGDTTTEPVIVVVVPSSVNLYYGESFTVTCYATGRPAPDDVTWYNPNGELITSSTDGVSVVEITTSLSILAVSDLSANDEGEYTCVGINILSNGIIYTDTATVNVTGNNLMNGAGSDAGCDNEDRCDRVLLVLVILIPAILIVIMMIIIMYCYLRHSSCRSTYGDNDSDSDEVKSKETVTKKTSKMEIELDEIGDNGHNEDIAVPYPSTGNTYESIEEPKATIPTYDDIVELHAVSTDDKKLEQPVMQQPSTNQLKSNEAKAIIIPKDDPKPVVSGVLFLPEPFTLTIEQDHFEKENDNIDGDEPQEFDSTKVEIDGDYDQGGQFEVNDSTN